MFFVFFRCMLMFLMIPLALVLFLVHDWWVVLGSLVLDVIWLYVPPSRTGDVETVAASSNADSSEEGPVGQAPCGRRLPFHAMCLLVKGRELRPHRAAKACWRSAGGGRQKKKRGWLSLSPPEIYFYNLFTFLGNASQFVSPMIPAVCCLCYLSI